MYIIKGAKRPHKKLRLFLNIYNINNYYYSLFLFCEFNFNNQRLIIAIPFFLAEYVVISRWRVSANNDNGRMFNYPDFLISGMI